MEIEMVKLWTRQDIRSLKQLEEKGVYRVKEQYIQEQFGIITDHYLKLYKWFVEAASKKVEKPDEVTYPIWCAVDKRNMLRPIENTVVYELEIERSKVIYFDGAKWDYVLNHLYIPKDEEDEKKYKEDMKKKGFDNVFSFIEGKYSHFPFERKRVMDSWHRIFEIDEWNIFKVQGNIWEIHPEMIKNIIHYNG